MLIKSNYKKIIKGLDKLKYQDRKENPSRIPIDWKNQIISLIEQSIREEKEIFSKHKVEATLKYIIENKLIVPYLNGYSFPGRFLPTEAEIRKQVQELI